MLRKIIPSFGIFYLFSADGKFEVSFKSNVVLNSTGHIMWIPCAIYKSSCTVDVKYFPFDEQQCSMIYGSWTFNGNEVDLKPYTSGFTNLRAKLQISYWILNFIFSYKQIVRFISTSTNR
jgi:Neurotransmitter-gated ion-channel ligand binding domain